MKCNHCGAEIANDSVFCEHCGTKAEPKKNRKWLKPTLIVGGIVLLIGIILGIIAIINGSRWDEIYNNRIANWPSCQGGDGTFYILQRREEQSLVRVEGEFPISIIRLIDYNNGQIFSQEGDHDGIGVFANLYRSGAIMFSIFKPLDDGKVSRVDITNCEGKELCSDNNHIYGIDKDHNRCGDSAEWLNTIFACNRQPVRLGISGKWQYIDMEGNIAISEKFENAHTFRYDVAKVYSQYDGLPYYIRPDGTVIKLYHNGDMLQILECGDFHYDWQRRKAVAEANVRYFNEASGYFGILIDTEGNILEQSLGGWNSYIMDDYLKVE